MCVCLGTSPSIKLTSQALKSMSLGLYSDSWISKVCDLGKHLISPNLSSSSVKYG